MGASLSRVTRVIVACAVGALLCPAVLSAQDQVRVAIDAGVQTATPDFAATAVFTEFVEEGQVTTNHKVGTGFVFGGGVMVRAWQQLAVGAAVSFFSKNGTGQLEAELPHPFLFNQHRVVSGEVSDLKRREIATHILVGWIAPIPANQMEVTLSAGPSIFHVQQDLVSGVTYTHEFPYDVAVFTGAITRRLEKAVVGFNVGGDVTWKLSNDVGLAVSGRYSHATVNDDETGASMDPGGLQLGGGVRFFF